MTNSRPIFTFTAQIEVEMQRYSHVIELTTTNCADKSVDP